MGEISVRIIVGVVLFLISILLMILSSVILSSVLGIVSGIVCVISTRLLKKMSGFLFLCLLSLIGMVLLLYPVLLWLFKYQWNASPYPKEWFRAFTVTYCNCHNNNIWKLCISYIFNGFLEIRHVEIPIRRSIVIISNFIIIFLWLNYADNLFSLIFNDFISLLV